LWVGGDFLHPGSRLAIWHEAAVVPRLDARVVDRSPMDDLVQLVWSRALTNYVLETSTALSSNPWQAADLPISVSTFINSVNVPASEAQRFFRLRSPGP